MHAHLQLIPIPKESGKKHANLWLLFLAFYAMITFQIAGKIRSTFETEGAKHGIEFIEMKEDQQLSTIADGQQYLYVEYYDVESKRLVRLFHRIRGRHFLQFGREVAAIIIGDPKLAIWQVRHAIEAIIHLQKKALLSL